MAKRQTSEITREVICLATYVAALIVGLAKGCFRNPTEIGRPDIGLCPKTALAVI